MSSRLVLIAHTTAFSGFVALSAIVSFLLMTRQLAGSQVLVGAAALAVIVLVSWIPFKDACPFTAWENHARAKEGKQPYTEACIIHYAREWLGISLPYNSDNVIIGVVFAIPILLSLLDVLAFLSN